MYSLHVEGQAARGGDASMGQSIVTVLAACGINHGRFMHESN